MGLQDYVYRLKAQSGDSTPHDETGTSGDLSGGTITLVDRGSGDYAWQFSGGPASVSIPSYALQTTTTGGGFTVAARVRISNYGSTDYQYFVGVGANAATGTTDQGNGVVIGREGVNTMRTRYRNESAPASWTQGTTEVTVVMVVEMNYSGANDRLTTYRGATSVSTVAFNATSNTIDTVWVQAQSGAVVQVADLVVWYEELSSTDCEALRDNGINATLDAAGDITGSLAATEAADVSAITGDVIITGTLAATEAADVAAFSGGSTPVTGDLDATEASDTAAATGTVRNPRLVIGPLKNNTGTLLANETGATVYVYQTSGAHVVTKTGQTTDGSAIMTVSDAALAAGTTYRFVIALGSGAEGMDKLAAA